MKEPIKWDAEFKGDGWAGRILARVYANRKLTVFGPLVLGAVLYGLFLIFGENPDKSELIWKTPLIAVLEYVGLLAVLGIQLRNSLCSPKSMDLMVLLFTVAMLLIAALSLKSFLLNMDQGFAEDCVACCTGFSAIAQIQGKRK